MTMRPARTDPAPAGSRTAAAAVRAVLLFGVWIVVDQSPKPANLVVGVLTTIAATWVSLRLLPPERGRVRPGRLLTLLPRFLWQSLVAGLDVARRAFAPRLDLQPGFVDHRTQLPRGTARSAFELIASLMPGSVPSDDGPQHIEFHCLDTRQPVAQQMAAEERAYAPALQGERRDG
ncbi:MAG: Na+/H+ antiporter subunit E [Burkholderiales bacterium]|nr:Na+/H+ antiporter subunit E [Burkholderiales bacterium]